MDALFELLDKTVRALERLDAAHRLDTGRRHRLRDVLETLSRRSERWLDQLEDDGPSSRRRKYREELLEKGLSALARDQFEVARTHFREGVEEFPDDLEFLNHLGLSCWEDQLYREAAQWYGRALESGLETLTVGEGNRCERPSSAYLRAMEGRALSLERLGRKAEAATLFDALATLCPGQYAGCHYRVAAIHHEHGRLERALEAYRRAPEEPAVLYHRAIAQFELGALESAAADAIRAFEANPHVASKMLEVSLPATWSGRGGYVGSSTYAEEVAESSDPLWERSDEARAFLERCMQHPLVLEYLETAEGLEESSSLPVPPHELEDRCVAGLAEYLAERIE